MKPSMGRKAISKIAIAMVAVLAVVVVSIAFYLFSGTESGGQGPKPGTTPGTVYVSNVEIERYLYEDEGLYMRLKISGEADLRGL